MKKRSHLSYANYVLEEWAMWVLSSDGFSSISAIANLGNFRGGTREWLLPLGIDHNSLVSDAIFVFHTMMKSEKGARETHILRAYLLNRDAGESIKAFCKRHKEFNHNQYAAALNAFSNRLDMYYELVKSKRIN